MRFVRHALLTAAATAVVAGGAAAQTLGTGTGGTGTGTGTGGTTTGTGSGGTGTGGTGAGTGSTTASAAVPVIEGGSIAGTSSTSTATGGGVDASNFLGSSYSNPYYQGTFTNSDGTPGGFGLPLFGTGGGGSPGTTASAGNRTTATGTGTRSTTGGRTTGGRTTTGGANPFGTSGSPFGTTGGQTGRAGGGGQFGGGGGFGSAATSQFGGQVIPLPRNIAYQAVLRFPTPSVAPAQQLADVQAVLSRSSMLSSPAGVTVVQDGTVLVLRGAVASEDEARLAEGMVRLTPGVREVRNELAFPKQ